MIKIYKNNKWKYKNRDEIMDEIINIITHVLMITIPKKEKKI